MNRRRKACEAGGAAFASPAPTADGGGPDEAGGVHAVCRARAGELEARLAASEATASEQGGRLAAAATTEAELRASLASAGGRLSATESAASELGGRLAEAEVAASELRAANEVLARELAAVNGGNAVSLASSQALQATTEAKLPASLASAESALCEQGGRRTAVEAECALRTARFLERRRDFGAELPPLVLLHIMDRAPGPKCVLLLIL